MHQEVSIRFFCSYFFSIVGEEASIYSVSEEAEKEMPNLDVNLRSAGIGFPSCFPTLVLSLA